MNHNYNRDDNIIGLSLNICKKNDWMYYMDISKTMLLHFFRELDLRIGLIIVIREECFIIAIHPPPRFGSESLGRLVGPSLGKDLDRGCEHR
jgi:hypothetical protein